MTMSNLVQLTKEETKELETKTFHYMYFKRKHKTNDIIFKILGWYDHNGLNANSSIYKKWKKLSELLGYEPNYYPIYRNKNALWGLQLNNTKFLVYYSVRGILFQFEKDTTPEQLHEVFYKLKELLFKKD